MAENRTVQEGVANYLGEVEMAAVHRLEEGVPRCDRGSAHRDWMSIQIHRESSGCVQCYCEPGYCRYCSHCRAVGADLLTCCEVTAQSDGVVVHPCEHLAAAELASEMAV